jgi:hypothetical protein
VVARRWRRQRRGLAPLPPPMLLLLLVHLLVPLLVPG